MNSEVISLLDKAPLSDLEKRMVEVARSAAVTYAQSLAAEKAKDAVELEALRARVVEQVQQLDAIKAMFSEILSRLDLSVGNLELERDVLERLKEKLR